MTDNQLARRQETWRKMALVKERISNGETIREALRTVGLHPASYYAHRHDTAPPGQEQPVTTPARKALPAPPAKPAPSPLNYCPHCGKNLRAVNIALNMNHE